MILPCMRILARAGSSCPALYPPSRVLLHANRFNGGITGVYRNGISRTTARWATTLLHRTSDPNNEAEDFIPHLYDSVIEAIQKPGTTTRRYILFQTTPYYSHLVSDPAFLRAIIDRAVQTADIRIDSVEVAAVVMDGIPQNLEPPKEGWNAFITDRRMSFYGDTTTAYQNFEFKPPPIADIQESPRHDFPVYNNLSRNPDDDRGTFQLVFQAVNTAPTPENEQKSLLRRQRERLYVKMKLANTIFQNGIPATAMVHIYRVEVSEDGSATRIVPELVERTKDLTVKLSGAQVWHPRVEYRLRRLTLPRYITDSVGNIIKKIRVNDKDVPASHELEDAMARWNERHPSYDPITLEKHPLQVFARISADKEKEVGHRTPHKSVKFARVLAGGGGWGESAGILALDPDTLHGKETSGVTESPMTSVGAIASAVLQQKWVTFYVNDPIYRGARAISHPLQGQWVFTMVGKDHTFWTKHRLSGQAPNKDPALHLPPSSNTVAKGEEVTTAPSGSATALPLVLNTIDEGGATASSDSKTTTVEATATTAPSDSVAASPSVPNTVDEGEATTSSDSTTTTLEATTTTAPSNSVDASPSVSSTADGGEAKTSSYSTTTTVEATITTALSDMNGAESTNSPSDLVKVTNVKSTNPTKKLPGQGPGQKLVWKPDQPSNTQVSFYPLRRTGHFEVTKKPPQTSKTGTDVGMWINMNKVEIPGFTIKLDLLQELGDFGGAYTPVRFVGISRPDKVAKKASNKKYSRKPWISLSFQGKPNYEGEKYESELKRARIMAENGEYYHFEGSDLIVSEPGPPGRPVEIPTAPDSSRERTDDEVYTELELQLHRKRTKTEDGIEPEAVSQETKHEAAREDGAAPSKEP